MAHYEIWNASLDKRLATFDTNGGPKAAWSKDGRRVAVPDYTRPVLFDAALGTRLADVDHRGLSSYGGERFQLSTDGKTLRTLHRQELLLLNAETGEYLKKIGNFPWSHLATSPKDDWLVVYDVQKPVEQLVLVDTATYEQRIPVVGHTDRLTGVRWSSDGKHFASASLDKTVRIWKAGPMPTLIQTLTHERPVNNLAWSPDGQRMATCADDQRIRVWSIHKGLHEQTYDPVPSPPFPGPDGIAWSPTGDLLALAPSNARALHLNLKTGQYSDAWVVFQGGMNDVAWSPDGKQIVAVNHGELGYRALSSTTAQHVHGYGSPVQWLPDSRRIVTGQAGARPLQAVDTRRGLRLGALFPRMMDGGWLCIGADGHYRGSEGVESQIVYVALHKDGSQTTHTPAEFAERYKWKNDPTKATFLKLREGRPGK
jgi:WD40 repeat protein